MAKITDLPEAGDLDGSEAVPIVKGGMTRRATLGGVVAAVATPFVSRAEAAANVAEGLIGKTYPNVSAGEQATAAEQSFAVGNSDGTVTVYLRTSGGSEPQRTIWTTAAAESPQGAGRLRTLSGESVQDRLNRTGHSAVNDLLNSNAGAAGEGAVHRAGPYSYKEAAPAAPDYHVVTAQGVKMYVMPQDGGMPLGAFGVDESGSIASDFAIARALATAATMGGARLTASPSAVVKNNLLQAIRTRDVFVDMRGGRFEGSGQFWWDGTGAHNGDRSAIVSGGGMTDAYFGGTHKGPRFDFCENPQIKRLVRMPGNKNGTFINVLKCRGGTMEDVLSWDSEPTKIGGLVHLCDEFQVRGFRLCGGEYVYGLQIKGGLGNSVRDGLQRDIKVNHAWRDRGDAPWGPSTSPGIYPWENLGWDVADERRASRRTFWENLHCENVTGLDTASAIHFYAYEALRHQSIGCSSDGTGAVGYYLGKAVNGREHGHKVARFDFEGTGIVQTGMLLVTEDATRMDDVVLEECNVKNVTGGRAVRAEGINKLKFVGGQYNDNTGNEALSLSNCMDPIVEKVVAKGNAYPLRILANPAGSVPKIKDNDFRGNAQPWNCNFPCEASGNKGNPAHSFDNSGTPSNTVQRFAMADGDSWVIELTVDYKLSGGQTGRFAKALTAFKSGGAITMSALANLQADMNADGLTGFTVTNSGGTELRMNIGGKAGDSGVMTVSRINFTQAGV